MESERPFLGRSSKFLAKGLKGSHHAVLPVLHSDLPSTLRHQQLRFLERVVNYR